MDEPSKKPTAVVRDGYLYTDSPDGEFCYIGPDLYVFIAGGAVQYFIRHRPLAPEAEFREMTDMERSAWDSPMYTSWGAVDRAPGWTLLKNSS